MEEDLSGTYQNGDRSGMHCFRFAMFTLKAVAFLQWMTNLGCNDGTAWKFQTQKSGYSY